jgi:hypothetical protein
MKSTTIMSCLLAAALSGLTAAACQIQIRVACPGDGTSEGIEVCIQGSQEGCVETDAQGIALFHVPELGNYTAHVTKSSLPPGATLTPLKQTIKVLTDTTTYAEFILGGEFCGPPEKGDFCWMTGGGTVGKAKGVPNYSFGGVVYPGCSPKAADGGNWNVVDHATGLHFQGQKIIVDSCGDAPTGSPAVNVRTIYFHGKGIIGGIGGNLDATVPVDFEGRVTDNKEGGAGSDLLYVKVVNEGGTTVLLQIGTSAVPAVISTGNLQIHTTSCN